MRTELPSRSEPLGCSRGCAQLARHTQTYLEYLVERGSAASCVHSCEAAVVHLRHVEADLEMKEKVLARLEAPDIKLKRFGASDDLMKFLKALQLCKAPRAPVRPLILQTAVPGGALPRIVETYA